MVTVLKKQVVFLLIFSIALLFVPRLNAQSEISEIDILSNSTTFLNISLEIQPRNATNNVIEIRSEDLNVFDSGIKVENFSLNKSEPEPVSLYYLIDFGRDSNYSRVNPETLKTMLNGFTQANYFREEVDTVAIFGHSYQETNVTSEILLPTRAQSDFNTAINSLQLLGQNEAYQSEGLKGLEAVLTRIEEDLGPEQQRRSSILFLMSHIHWPTTCNQATLAESIAERAKSLGTTIHVIQTLNGDLSCVNDAALTLTGGTGGKFLTYSPAISSFNYNIDRTNEIYTAVMNQGMTYRLDFETTLFEPGDREIQLISTINPEVSQKIDVNVSFDEPLIKIIQYEQVVQRQFQDGSYTNPLTNIELDVVSWPTDITLDNLSAEVFVDGVSKVKLPSVSPDSFVVELPIGDITESTDLELQVWLMGDKFRAISDLATIQVVVDPISSAQLGNPCELDPSSDACREETLKAEATATAIASVLQASEVSAEATRQAAESLVLEAEDEVASSRARTSLLSLVFLVSLAIMGFMLWRTRRTLSKRLVSAQQVMAQGGGLAEVAKTLVIGGDGALGRQSVAKLFVESGPAKFEQEEILLYDDLTTIGREPQICDIPFYEVNEKSTVSAKHATIQMENNQFLITDLNSSNGTFVNGRRISPNTPTKIVNEDEIVMGDVFRQGLRFKFLVENGSNFDGPIQVGESASLQANELGDDVAYQAIPADIPQIPQPGEAFPTAAFEEEPQGNGDREEAAPLNIPTPNGDLFLDDPIFKSGGEDGEPSPDQTPSEPFFDVDDEDGDADWLKALETE